MRISTKALLGSAVLILADGAPNPDIAKRLKGVTVTVKPVDSAMRVAARYAAHRAMAQLPPKSEDRAGIAEFAYTVALVRLGATGWAGIGNKDLPIDDPDYNKDLPLKPEAMVAAMEDRDFYDAMDRLYVTPDLNSAAVREDEKNA